MFKVSLQASVYVLVAALATENPSNFSVCCCTARDILVQRLQEICTKENVRCGSEVLEALIEASDGDLRRAITFLQSTANHSYEEAVTVDDINEITGRIPDHWLEGLVDVCRSGVYDSMQSYMSLFAAEGYSASQLLLQLHEKVVFSSEFNDTQKSSICEKMAVSCVSLFVSFY